jgi:hypothetical protein
VLVLQPETQPAIIVATTHKIGQRAGGLHLGSGGYRVIGIDGRRYKGSLLAPPNRLKELFTSPETARGFS